MTTVLTVAFYDQQAYHGERADDDVGGGVVDREALADDASQKHAPENDGHEGKRHRDLARHLQHLVKVGVRTKRYLTPPAS